MITNLKLINMCKERGIEELVHFTNVTNLPSILDQGLLSREYLDYYFIDYSYNDSYRMDSVKNSVSLSVTSPNYKMFYKLRCANPNTHWAIILLNAIDVLKLDCAFCYTNAANSYITNIPIDDRKTTRAFESMFMDELFGNKRSDIGLELYETTDPQAEILVMETIPVSAIDFIVFDSYGILNQYKPIIEARGISCSVDLGYYRPRRDYEYWR